MRLLAALSAIAALGVAMGPAAAPAAADVTWVCKPGQANNICLESLTTTVYEPGGGSRVGQAPIPANPPVDCFYVYPTVSNQVGPNATKAIDPEIEGIVRFQAARFSQQCRVFAPVYRQNTVPALLAQGRYTTPESRQLAYADVVEAWRDYMKRYNGGRGVVLIGHSQGSFHLRRLLRTEIDPKPALRRQLVSAVLLGGNVLVKRGQRERRRLSARPGVPGGGADRLRDRLLALQRDPARRPALRQAAGRPRPRDRQPRWPGLRGALHQPGLARRQPAGAGGDAFPSRPFPPASSRCRSPRPTAVLLPWLPRPGCARPTDTPAAARPRTGRTC